MAAVEHTEGEVCGIALADVLDDVDEEVIGRLGVFDLACLEPEVLTTSVSSVSLDFDETRRAIDVAARPFVPNVLILASRQLFDLYDPCDGGVLNGFVTHELQYGACVHEFRHRVERRRRETTSPGSSPSAARPIPTAP